MATISTADFKNGMGLKINDKYYTIVEFQHVKPGKGGAFVRYKIRDLKTGRVIDQTCNAGTKFESVMLTTREFQYLYNDGTDYIFMDNESYEQMPINGSVLGDNFKFVKENMDCKVLSYKGNVFGVEPPNFVELEVTKTEPGVRGDTATNTLKPATLETGAEIRVPLFINEGEMIRIDTRTGEYMERA